MKKVSSKMNEKQLMIKASGVESLSPTQIEFNRLMKSLELARAKHEKDQAKLDAALVTASLELMPLVEELKCLNRDLVLCGIRALDAVKLNAKRRYWFSDLLAGKASELIDDPVGLSEEDVEKLGEIVRMLFPEGDPSSMDEDDGEEFDFLTQEIEEMARASGVDLDLSGIDPKVDPEDFVRLLRERFAEAGATAQPKKRKSSKAQLEKERKKREQEEAKNKDIKSLFKQLAKAFHPDLEPDLVLREHKEALMKRLNAAYAGNDLREMLSLEMEWLGEEATNLAAAGDEKLKVYCAVLKEQIAEQKMKTRVLIHESQYGLLHRFLDPMFNTVIPASQVKAHYRFEIERHLEMLEVLNANNIHTKKMISQWADTNYQNSQYPF